MATAPEQGGLIVISLGSARVAFLTPGVGGGRELRHCWQAVLARGGEPVLVAAPGAVPGPDWRATAAGLGQADAQVTAIRPADYSGLVLIRPYDADLDAGGIATPEFIAGFFDLGLPVAASCRAAFDLARADVIRGRTVTSEPGLRQQVTAAGAAWIDRPVARCTSGAAELITASTPASLPVFCDEFTRTFAAGGVAAGLAAPAGG
jgi:protease I